MSANLASNDHIKPISLRLRALPSHTRCDCFLVRGALYGFALVFARVGVSFGIAKCSWYRWGLDGVRTFVDTGTVATTVAVLVFSLVAS